jgi:hypothetical protein
MVGQSARIQFNDHLNLLLQSMGLEQYMVVLLVHHLLLFVLDLSTKKQNAFKKRQKLQQGRLHQAMPCLARGNRAVSGSGSYCRYKKCPGLKMKKKITRGGL